MACGATLSLKRSLEFDPVHSPGQHSPKRRRCIPMTMSPSTPPTKSHQVNPSPFNDAATKLNNEQIAARISAELKRMQRRKQLQFPSTSASTSSDVSPPSPLSQACADISDQPTDSQANTSCQLLSPSKKDVPLFTFKHLSMICERMLKEREEHIKEEYDKVLTCKLAEQYEAFLKFNHDQLHRRFNESAASYVS